jgi:hypothetical protein
MADAVGNRRNEEKRMKPKTGFESGSSPTIAGVGFSQHGALIQTGRGLEETKRRIMKAFEDVRCPISKPMQPTACQGGPQVETIYTEHHRAQFHSRVQTLTSVALFSSQIAKTEARRNSSEVVVPVESAEQLIAEALRWYR